MADGKKKRYITYRVDAFLRDKFLSAKSRRPREHCGESALRFVNFCKFCLVCSASLFQVLAPWVLSSIEVVAVLLLYFIGTSRALVVHQPPNKYHFSFTHSLEDIVGLSITRAILLSCSYAWGVHRVQSLGSCAGHKPYLYASYLLAASCFPYIIVKTILFRYGSDAVCAAAIFVLTGLFSWFYVFAARRTAEWARRTYQMGLAGFGNTWEEGEESWTMLRRPDLEEMTKASDGLGDMECSDDVTAESLADDDSKFMDVFGIKVHYKEVMPHGNSSCSHSPGSSSSSSESDDPNSTGIVLVHGYGGGVFAWRHVMQALAMQCQCRVVAFDRPAFGLTSRPQVSQEHRKGSSNPYSMPAQAELLLQLCSQLGLKRVFLVAHADACMLALQVASMAEMPCGTGTSPACSMPGVCTACPASGMAGAGQSPVAGVASCSYVPPPTNNLSTTQSVTLSARELAAHTISSISTGGAGLCSWLTNGRGSLRMRSATTTQVPEVSGRDVRSSRSSQGSPSCGLDASPMASGNHSQLLQSLAAADDGIQLPSFPEPVSAQAAASAADAAAAAGDSSAGASNSGLSVAVQRQSSSGCWGGDSSPPTSPFEAFEPSLTHLLGDSAHAAGQKGSTFDLQSKGDTAPQQDLDKALHSSLMYQQHPHVEDVEMGPVGLSISASVGVRTGAQAQAGTSASVAPRHRRTLSMPGPNAANGSSIPASQQPGSASSDPHVHVRLASWPVLVGLALLHPNLMGQTGPALSRLLARSGFGRSILRPLLRSEVGEVANRRAWHHAERLTPEVMELYKAPLRVEGWDMALMETARLGKDQTHGDLQAYIEDAAQLPMLVVTAVHDYIATPLRVERLWRSVPHAQLAVLPDCGHLSHEEAPGLLLQQLVPFCSQVLQQGQQQQQ